MSAPALALRGMGSFHAGGRTVLRSGGPVREVVFTPGSAPARLDPNGVVHVGQMYVQFMLPAVRLGAAPLVFWHGGGMTGATWETTPDGREGWAQWFLRRGWDVHVCDAAERGRSGFPPPGVLPDEPVFQTVAAPFERFRIGEGPGSWHADPARRRVLPGCRFPVAAYDEFVRQMVPRWIGSDETIIAAHIAALERIGPSVLLCHSQGGAFAFRVAGRRPDLVRAIVAVEPAALPPPAEAAGLAAIPVLLVYGDFIAVDPRWRALRAEAGASAAAISHAGGDITLLDLPAEGIAGNSHLLMMDDNSDEIAALIQGWLAARALVREG